MSLYVSEPEAECLCRVEERVSLEAAGARAERSRSLPSAVRRSRLQALCDGSRACGLLDARVSKALYYLQILRLSVIEQNNIGTC